MTEIDHPTYRKAKPFTLEEARSAALAGQTVTDFRYLKAIELREGEVNRLLNVLGPGWREGSVVHRPKFSVDPPLELDDIPVIEPVEVGKIKVGEITITRKFPPVEKIGEEVVVGEDGNVRVYDVVVPKDT